MKLTQGNIKQHKQALQQLMEQRGLSLFYISSSDPFLNEYVPMELCLRYYFTGFTGSTAEALVPAAGKVKLFVDGRYHEQADEEVDHEIVEVVKVKDKGLKESVLSQIPEGATLGYHAQRTPLKFAQEMEAKAQKLEAGDTLIEGIVSLPSLSSLPPVESLEGKIPISSFKEKRERVFSESQFKDGEGVYLNALDQIAWVSNFRGYHLPNLSSFLARAILTSHELHLFVDPSIEFKNFQSGSGGIHIHPLASRSLQETLGGVTSLARLTSLFYDPETLNASDYKALVAVWGQSCLAPKPGGLIPSMSIKDESEISLIKDSFVKSNRAIINVLKWIRSSMEGRQSISEFDIYSQTTACYREQGAITQSFNTISGVGPHSSIIHFSSPEPSLKVKEDDVVLLDSGGYFEGGFATDTTRTILASSEATPHPQLVEIFTYALKGLLQLQNAVVKEGTSGLELDQIARTPIKEKGYDYGHGTGHGVGIYVHEGGISVSPRSGHHHVKPGQVFSIEPGIYIPGFGGVRHENIVVARPHPEKKDHVYFEPLTWIGFDEKLLDRALLSPEEIRWFDEYQEKCLAMGNTL